MKRKLCSILLSAFAVLLLMGASMESNSIMAVEVEGLESDIQTYITALVTGDEAVEAQAGTALSEAEIFVPENIATGSLLGDNTLLVNGEAVGQDTKKTISEGVSYVAIQAMSLELDPTAVVTWDGDTSTITVQTDKLTLTAQLGQYYVVANGRYLYVPQAVKSVSGVAMMPLSVLTEAFDATVEWDGEAEVISVTTGSGGILSGDEFYAEDTLFWLSRLIYAESGFESLAGRIGVGNVVLNRVKSPIYPNTMLEVIAQTNQFSTYQNGALANRTPNEGSIIAAKLVLDGAVVAGLETATHFDTGGNTWAYRNKTCLAVIGGHKFYG